MPNQRCQGVGDFIRRDDCGTGHQVLHAFTGPVRLIRIEAMERDIHPAETSLFVAATLRGLRLSDAAGGGYRVERQIGDQVELVAGCASFTEVANLCGATGSITMRQAAERDGLKWPDSAQAFLAALKNI